MTVRDAPRLFVRREIDPKIRAAYDVQAGWQYGLVFGAMLALASFGGDAFEQATLAVEFFWLKLAVAFLVFVPLSMLTGVVSARIHRTYLGLIPWLVVGGGIGFIVVHIPYEGVSWVLSLLDSSAYALYPFVPAAGERVWGSVLFSIIFVAAAGGLQIGAATLVWDTSSESNHTTFKGWLVFIGAALPVVLILGLVFDNAANEMLRVPMRSVNSVIQIASKFPPDANLQTVPANMVNDFVLVSQVRQSFTPKYTLRLASVDRKSPAQVYVDVEFDNGFLWRCKTGRGTGAVNGCVDLIKQYDDVMRQFLARGIVQCNGCAVGMSPQATAWQKDQTRNLGEVQRIDVEHRAGGLARVRATLANSAKIECVFLGADPIQIDQCHSF